MFPIKRRLDWTVAGADDYKLEDKELKERQAYYNKNIKKPCFILGNNNDFNKLKEEIISFFTDEE